MSKYKDLLPKISNQGYSSLDQIRAMWDHQERVQRTLEEDSELKDIIAIFNEWIKRDFGEEARISLTLRKTSDGVEVILREHESEEE